MTKQEFIDYVASFEKNPGEYTEEEVYDICKKFTTELSVGERNWMSCKECWVQSVEMENLAKVKR